MGNAVWAPAAGRSEPENFQRMSLEAMLNEGSPLRWAGHLAFPDFEGFLGTPVEGDELVFICVLPSSFSPEYTEGDVRRFLIYAMYHPLIVESLHEHFRCVHATGCDAQDAERVAHALQMGDGTLPAMTQRPVVMTVHRGAGGSRLVGAEEVRTADLYMVSNRIIATLTELRVPVRYWLRCLSHQAICEAQGEYIIFTAAGGHTPDDLEFIENPFETLREGRLPSIVAATRGHYDGRAAIMVLFCPQQIPREDIIRHGINTLHYTAAYVDPRRWEGWTRLDAWRITVWPRDETAWHSQNDGLRYMRRTHLGALPMTLLQTLQLNRTIYHNMTTGMCRCEPDDTLGRSTDLVEHPASEIFLSRGQLNLFRRILNAHMRRERAYVEDVHTGPRFYDAMVLQWARVQDANPPRLDDLLEEEGMDIAEDNGDDDDDDEEKEEGHGEARQQADDT